MIFLVSQNYEHLLLHCIARPYSFRVCQLVSVHLIVSEFMKERSIVNKKAWISQNLQVLKRFFLK